MRDTDQSNQAGKIIRLAFLAWLALTLTAPLTATNRLTFRGKYLYYRESSISSTA